jgi:hypothetical protein
MIDCDLQPDGDIFRCSRCGWTYRRGDVRRNCPSARIAQPVLTEADLAICRAPCEHYHRDGMQEWCDLDVGQRADGSPCQAAAVRAWAERMFGRRPKCPCQLGEV